jgi:hypothetical protein
MTGTLRSFLGFGGKDTTGDQPEQSVAPSLGWLSADLLPLSRVKASFGPRALRFVHEGGDASILLDLAAYGGGGAVLKLRCLDRRIIDLRGAATVRDKLLSAFGPEHAPAVLRLAQVYEAASRNEPRTLTLGWLGAPSWLEVLLREVVGQEIHYVQKERSFALPIALLERMLALDEADPSLPVRGALLADPHDWQQQAWRECLVGLRGLPEAVERHPDAVRAALGAPAAVKARALELLHRLPLNLTPHLETLVDLATGSAKKVREAATPLLHARRAAVRPLLEARAREGDGETREHAVVLLWRIEGEAVRALLQERLEQESSKKVRQKLEEMLTSSASAPGHAATTTVEASALVPELALPVIAELDPAAPLGDELRALIAATLERWNNAAEKSYKSLKAARNRYARAPASFDDRRVARICEHLEHWRYRSSAKPEHVQLGYWGVEDTQFIRPVLEHPEFRTIHFVRLLVLLNVVTTETGKHLPDQLRIGWGFERYARLFRRGRTPALSLRELAAAFRAAGFDDACIGWARLTSTRWNRRLVWAPAEVWPYFAERIAILEEAFGLRPPTAKIPDYFKNDIRRNAFAALEGFPVLPPQIEAMLWEAALGPSKQERPLAQAALAGIPGKEERIIAALASGKKDVRAAAAEWLANLDHRVAQPAIEQALAREKQETAKAALVSALERLGAPVDSLLNRDRLLGEATAGLAKGVPSDLEWFALDLVPVVRWADSGAIVDPAIVRWWLCQSHRLGSPEPGALLRRYAVMLEPGGREQLGQHVLASWIAQDTMLNTTADVEAVARQEAKQWAKLSQTTEQQAFELLLRAKLGQCKGSAIGSKGILAVAGACCGAAAARPIEQYLRKWYGQRAAQCKALLQMLAWVEHPAATQLLLAIATRFRTASIRKQAEESAHALAERKDWTVAELADRSIPTAGFERNEDGRFEMALDYGGRTLVATLDPECNIVLHAPDGGTLASLPDARKDDDPDKVKAAKKQLADARKQIKSVLALQRDRLYEAMCTERGWSSADWRTFLAEHPIAGHLCERLVWAAFAPGERGARLATFRLLSDGTLTAAEDSEVTLPADAVVRVAHGSNIPAELGAAWLSHLADYHVEPLFVQLGREPLCLDAERAEESVLADREGWLIEAFKLRSIAGKLGYVRGKAEDGGCFFTYHKAFPTLELEAILEFTGNTLPEENRTVALRTLSLVRTVVVESALDTFDWGARRVALGELPPVLLGECWHDLRQIAAQGAGFDPDWEKTTAW